MKLSSLTQLSIHFWQEDDVKDLFLYQKHMTMEFVSISDGEKAMANEGYVLFIKYLKLANFGAEHKELVFIKANMLRQ